MKKKIKKLIRQFKEEGLIDCKEGLLYRIENELSKKLDCKIIIHSIDGHQSLERTSSFWRR